MEDQVIQEEYKHKVELVQAMSELAEKEQDLKLSEAHRKAYIWSILVPPIGIYYFIKYVFFTGGEARSVKTGKLCLLLAGISFVFLILLAAVMMNMSVLTIAPEDQNSLKDLTIPENQKELIELLK